MSEKVNGSLLRFCEAAFSISFIMFSFVMFSCWFPTGFSSTFSSLSFLFALPLALNRGRAIGISQFEKIGLTLFAWLVASIFWSEIGTVESLGYLSEYRFYFMLPILTIALGSMPGTQKWGFHAALLGSMIALISSYGLGLGWWTVEGAQFSLANRIFHGFIMATFFLVCLIVSRETTGILRFTSGFLALLIAYNVLNIEQGRTGYLQIIAVGFIFTMISFGRMKIVGCTIGTILAICASYLLFDNFHAIINQSLSDVENMMTNDEYKTSIGHRLEFYRIALLIGADNLLGGVGVGDAVTELQQRFNSGQLRMMTDNVHSEFLNMLILGGVPAVVLFLSFLTSITWVGFRFRQTDKGVGDTLVGISVIILVSALFNSTIKDFGEKHALLIILSLLAARLYSVSSSPRGRGA